MNKYYTSDEYTVSPHSIKFDPEMVEFNRIQTDEEYQATKASIAKFGQLTPIAVNDKTGMGEDGRHRARACMELGIDVICRQVNGELDKATRLGLYNVDAMSGRDLTPAQKAIQAHKFIKMSNQTIAEVAKLIYDKNLKTEEGRELFWMMQGWKELPRNFKLIELINMVHTAPKDSEGDIE